MGKVATAVAATNTFNATNTQLKTYTDPSGFFTLQYPADWLVSTKQPVTRFDSPSVVFASNQPSLIVGITVGPSKSNSPLEFRNNMPLLATLIGNKIPGAAVLGEGFGVYSIAGYDTYSVLAEVNNANDPTTSKKALELSSRIGYQDMNIAIVGDSQAFDQQMPTVQKMIDSIKITRR